MKFNQLRRISAVHDSKKPDENMRKHLGFFPLAYGSLNIHVFCVWKSDLFFFFVTSGHRLNY